eukprot:3231093-Rhodomonas_salina.3
MSLKTSVCVSNGNNRLVPAGLLLRLACNEGTFAEDHIIHDEEEGRRRRRRVSCRLFYLPFHGEIKCNPRQRPLPQPSLAQYRTGRVAA